MMKSFYGTVRGVVSPTAILATTLVIFGLASKPAAAGSIYFYDVNHVMSVTSSDLKLNVNITGDLAFVTYTSSLNAAKTETAYADLTGIGDGLSERLSVSLVAGSPVIHLTFGFTALMSGSAQYLGSMPATGSFQNIINYINLGTGATVDSYFVRAAVAVPEPSSAVMAASAALALLGGASLRRRTRASA